MELTKRIMYSILGLGIAALIACGKPEEMHTVRSYPAVRVGVHQFLIYDKAPKGSDNPTMREIHMEALVGNPFPYRVDALDYGADRIREWLRIAPQREIPICLEILGEVTTKCTKEVVGRANYLLDQAEDKANAPLGFAPVPIH